MTEGKTKSELREWLERKGVSDSTLDTLEEAEVDGNLFKMLKEEDLQDLLKSFIERKKIRDIIRSVNETEDELVPFSSPPRPSSVSSSNFPSPGPSRISLGRFSYSPGQSQCLDSPDLPTLGAPSGVPTVPASTILENPDEYSNKDVFLERTKVIRMAMDSLLVSHEGRPSDSALSSMAKAICAKYPVLRDSSNGPVRDNYVMLHESM